MKKPYAKKLQAQRDTFNELVSVQLDSGEIRQTVTTSNAQTRHLAIPTDISYWKRNDGTTGGAVKITERKPV